MDEQWYLTRSTIAEKDEGGVYLWLARKIAAADVHTSMGVAHQVARSDAGLVAASSAAAAAAEVNAAAMHYHW